MKRGEFTLRSSNTYTPGIIKFNPKGFYKTREFYSSNYDDHKTGITAPDFLMPMAREIIKLLSNV